MEYVKGPARSGSTGGDLQSWRSLLVMFNHKI